MSDAYEIDGVKITPQPGGYYELTHASLETAEKVRGKEAAEARAAEIAKAAQDGEGKMEGQGNLTGAPRAPGDTSTTTAPANPNNPLDTPATDQGGDDKDKQIKELQDRLAASEAATKEAATERDALKTAAEKVATVVADQAPEPGPSLNAIPSRFEGEMSSEGKKALKAAGVGYTRIVLEEGDHVPPTGLFVSVNDRAYMIKPGEEVDVPDFILEVLDNARMSAPVVDSQNQKVLGYRERSRYPYRKV